MFVKFDHLGKSIDKQLGGVWEQKSREHGKKYGGDLLDGFSEKVNGLGAEVGKALVGSIAK